MDEQYLGAPDIYNSLSAYGEGKRISELLGNIFSKEEGIDFISARCFAFAGPFLRLDGTFAIGNFMKDALQERDIIIKGDGSPLRSYMYGADLVIWLLRILTHGKSGEAYNVGASEAISIKELADCISKETGINKVQVLASREKGVPLERYVPSVEKCLNELNLRVHFKVEAIVKKTFNYLNELKIEDKK
jgi:dTDP-glucose 4,6-dehydratase